MPSLAHLLSLASLGALLTFACGVTVHALATGAWPIALHWLPAIVLAARALRRQGLPAW